MCWLLNRHPLKAADTGRLSHVASLHIAMDVSGLLRHLNGGHDLRPAGCSWCQRRRSACGGYASARSTVFQPASSGGPSHAGQLFFVVLDRT